MNANKRVFTDVLILLLFAFPLFYFKKFGKPYKRGFFCNDQSLMHPFKESTVKNWMLYFIGLILPLLVIITGELVLAQKDKEEGEPVEFLGIEMPGWLVQLYKKIGMFAFGAVVAQLATDIGKYSIGRMRPHFLAVCQPVMSDGTSCDPAAGGGKYIEDFKCGAEGSSATMLKEMRLSFPSGHSSFTFYTMVYIALYLQARMTYKGSTLLRHFLQFLFIMIAWYTGLSRISDYKHHWSDVLAGSVLGTVVAIIMAIFVSDLFQGKDAELP